MSAPGQTLAAAALADDAPEAAPLHGTGRATRQAVGGYRVAVAQDPEGAALAEADAAGVALVASEVREEVRGAVLEAADSAPAVASSLSTS